MSYTIIFETKIVNLPDGRILHLSLSGCNNDDAGRDRHEFHGQIYTKEEWEKYIAQFAGTDEDIYDGFDLKIGSRYCKWSDYAKHLTTMQKRAMAWDELKELHGAYALTYDGINVFMKNGEETFFRAGKEADEAFKQIMKGTLSYSRYRRVCRELKDIDTIVAELDDKTSMEFYIGRRKKHSSSIIHEDVSRMKNTALEKAQNDKKALAKEYGVSTSAIVWIGNNHYIVVKSGEEIRV